MTKADYIEEYKQKYAPLWEAQKEISSVLKEALVAVCQKNMWLRVHGIPFLDDPALESDSPYSFNQIDGISALELFFEHGNWAIRSGVVHKNLFFCNQVDGGDEWWCCKLDEARNVWVPFESITFGGMIKDGSFRAFIDRLLNATIEQCVNLTY